MNKLVLFAAVLLNPATMTQGAVTFSGIDGTLDFNTSSGSYTIGGITVTLSANDGAVNATGTGLGINDLSSGDDTDGLDTINLTEVLSVSFDVDVLVNSFDFISIGTNDALDVSFNGGSAIPITSSGNATFGTTLLAGQLLTLTAIAPNAPTANNGVVITQFQVTQIPEPSASVLVGLACLGSTFIRQR